MPQIKTISENSFQQDFRISRQRLSEIFHRLKLKNVSNNSPFVPKVSPGPAVINLSSIPLTTQQNQVLSKG